MVKIKGETKLEKHHRKKKEMEEDLDYLRMVDLPAGQGQKYVADYEKDKADKVKKSEDDVKTSLEYKKEQFFGYRTALAEYGFNQLYKLDLPEGWEYYCIPTDGTDIKVFGKKFRSQIGVLVILRSLKQEVFIRGIKTTGDPELDVNAINTLVVQAENTVDSSKGILLSDNIDTNSTLRRTRSGILIPN